MLEFGAGSTADESGYDLPFLVGWLEDHIDSESERCFLGAGAGKHVEARLEAAEDAKALLETVMEWTPKDTKRYREKQVLERAAMVAYKKKKPRQ